MLLSSLPSAPGMVELFFVSNQYCNIDNIHNIVFDLSSYLVCRESEIKFHLSGVEYTVKPNDVSPETTLNAYLRDILHLTATKKMCLEGGCGTCIVAVEELDANGKKKVFAVNSCLVSIYSCHGWKILSNEGIGNPISGYHPIQKLLAENNGSQCGFCSSGMVMNMYALNESGGKTKAEIENSFGGNLCRCTGYRPILTAFKTLATDADGGNEVHDLEEFHPCNSIKCRQNECSKPCQKEPLYYNFGSGKWMKVYSLQDLLEILDDSGNERYMLVGGNTARGVYWVSDNPDLYIDITGVTELTTYSTTTDSLVLGANLALTDTMALFKKIAKANSRFTYLDQMANHLDLVAHVPVRNIGTIAGNLMIKYQHNEFPSDVFLILETVKAIIVIVDTAGNETRVTPENFLKIKMYKKVIKQIILPAYDRSYNYGSYKIMPRAQNAHAMINAGFLLKLSSNGIVQSATIVYGAINPEFVHASQTELLLKGKNLFDNYVLQSVFKSLDQELHPDWVLPDPKPEYRKQVAINLFYRYVLSIAPKTAISPRNRSGATILSRPVSSGTQQIYSKKELYPLTQPILKLEALAQTSGQAQYIIDMPDLPGQLHGVFVKAQTTPGSVIKSMDASNALKKPGVVAFYSAKDIPGLNSIGVKNIHEMVIDEVFCSGTVKQFSQPIGIIVATSHDIARSAAKLVTVSYTPPTTKPVLTIREIVQQNITNRIKHQTSFVPKSKGSDVRAVIKGEIQTPTQYHFHMENQNCLIIPTEDGFNVYAGTQWMDHVQGVVSQVLNIPSQKINVFVRRLGGSFGAKITRNSYLVAAASLAASKLQQPVRMWMDLNDNMDVIGTRFQLYTQYEVGVNAQGIIQYLTADLYTDFGLGGNEPVDPVLITLFQNCYIVDTWGFDTYTVNTDKYAFCYTRAPGSFEGFSTIETIMDHIAQTLKLDPFAVRRSNMNEKDIPILVNIINDVIKSDDIDSRKAVVAQYNRDNRWKKKGLSVIPMKWILEIGGNYTTLVSIYHLDGGVVVSHAGIEMGQGINTKAAQVCAYKLGIPLKKVSIKPSYNVISPNSFATGGSFTAEAVAYGVIKACDVLLDRIKPIRDQNPNASWEELIQLCYVANICLSANGLYSLDEPGIEQYTLYSCCALELEVDILTGKHEILRVDILQDVGQSMSPLIDIGQLEGAFIMGLGAHATEELIFNQQGQLMTNRSWNYKPPTAKDIPQDFRVRFLNNSLNPLGVLNSKAISEPPTCLSISYALALRSALASARKEASPQSTPWYTIDGPSTVEQTLLNALNDYKQYTL